MANLMIVRTRLDCDYQNFEMKCQATQAMVLKITTLISTPIAAKAPNVLNINLLLLSR